MEAREYRKELLFMGVLTSVGIPDSLVSTLTEIFGKIRAITPLFLFDYTDYYVPEMGSPIERCFIEFDNLISPDSLKDVKTKTNDIEKDYSVEGKRKINLDPGLVTEASVILATGKNRSHRIAIGNNLYAELTLIYQKGKWEDFFWTYSDYRDKRVQSIMSFFREDLLSKRRKG